MIHIVFLKSFRIGRLCHDKLFDQPGAFFLCSPEQKEESAETEN